MRYIRLNLSLFFSLFSLLSCVHLIHLELFSPHLLLSLILTRGTEIEQPDIPLFTTLHRQHTDSRDTTLRSQPLLPLPLDVITSTPLNTIRDYFQRCRKSWRSSVHSSDSSLHLSSACRELSHVGDTPSRRQPSVRFFPSISRRNRASAEQRASDL